MKQKTTLLFLLALFSHAAFAEMDIPESGRIRVDGNLNDWRRAKWIPLNTVIEGAPSNISNAVWSVAWDEDGVVFIALRYDDANPVLENGTHMTDCVEIYVRGDTGSSPTDYAQTQQGAQNYIFGLSKDKKTAWKKMGNLEKIPIHNPVQVAVTLNKNTFTYEIKVPVYDWFDATTRRKCSEAELFADKEIGLDIAIIDAEKSAPAGILGANNRTGKRTDANQIAEHLLED